MAKRKIEETEILPNRRRGVLSSLPDISGSQGIIGDSSMDDFLLESGETGRASTRSFNSINKLDNLAAAGKITGDEVEKAGRPFREQLATAARANANRNARVQNREFVDASEEDARFTDERARGDLQEAEAQKTALIQQITQARTGENPDFSEISLLRGQLGEINETIGTLRTRAGEADTAFSAARANRLASLAPQGGGRSDIEGVVTVRGPEDPLSRDEPIEQPGSAIRQELAGITARAEAGGILVPSDEEKQRIRREIDPQIKAAKTHAEKRELVAEMRARLRGDQTPLMKAKEAIAAFDRFDGIRQTPELLEVDAKRNAKLVAEVENIQAAMTNARGAKAKQLQARFKRASERLKRNITQQSTVLEERETAGREAATARLTLATDARDLAIEKFEQAIDDKNQAAIVAADAAVKKADDAREVEVEKQVQAELANFEAGAKADREATAKADKAAGVVTAAANKTLRTQAAARLTAGLEQFDNEIFNTKGRIADLVKFMKENPGRGTEANAADKKELAQLRDKILGFQRQKINRQKRVVDIGRAKIIDGGFAPLPPFPDDRGQTITLEGMQAYRRFFGDDAVAKKVMLDDGWIIPK